MTSELHGWRIAARTNDRLGETPLWHSDERRLYWIDFYGPRVHRLDPLSGEVRSWSVPGATAMGSLAFASAGRLLLATDRGVLLFDPSTEETKPFADPNGGREGIGYNDAKVDRAGRYWLGTFDLAETEPRGILYRISPYGKAVVADSGYTVCNGPAFSPGGAILYFSDSMGKRLLAYDVDPHSGDLRNRRRFADIDRGLPDGLAADRDGGVWCALYGAGEVRRFAPDGACTHALAFPAKCVTAICLGGDDLSTLYATSGPPPAGEAPDEGGALFAREVDVAGLPEPLFPIS